MTDTLTSTSLANNPSGKKLIITSSLLEEKFEKLKPTLTVVRNMPILSHEWAESAIETRNNVTNEDCNTSIPCQEIEYLIPQHEWTEMHGFLGNQNWSFPIKISHNDNESRPGYASKKAHEYEDTPEVLSAKIKVLARLIKRASNCLVYSGAGISTSSGINDYASQHGSVALESDRPKLRSPYEARPTLAHHGIVAMYRANLVKYWIQQNHDGLPQKAGLPQHAINEIHGAWYDPSNPVVAMSGNLRSDLFEDMLAWEDRTDLTLSMGTTMCGMNSDRVFVTVAKKGKNAHRNRNTQSIGGVIINLQQTQYDSISCLRIFAKLDTVLEMLIHELGLPTLHPLENYSLYSPSLSGIHSDIDDVFQVKYDRNGMLIQEVQSNSLFEKIADGLRRKRDTRTTTTLDLRVGSRVKLVSGPRGGDEGEVLGKNREGHYRIQFMHTIGKSGLKRPFETVLGSWWVEAAVRGTVQSIPIVNCT